MLFIPEEAIPLIIAVLLIVAFVLFIRAVFRFLKWLFSGILGRQTTRHGQSDYWLDKAQERQEIRFQNSMPPVRGEAKPQKKRFQEVWNESRGLSPTGWKFNEETGLWESPEQQKMKK